MAPQDLPISRGSRWRRKVLALAGVTAITLALSLPGASASADEGGVTDTSTVQTTEPTVEEPAPEKESDPTTNVAEEDVVKEDVVEQTPESKTNPDPAPEPDSDPASTPEQEEDAVEEEAPNTFAKLLAPEGDVQVADVVYDVTIGDAQGDCNNPGVNQSGFWDVRVGVDPYPGFNWHAFATPESGIGGDASAYNTSGTTTLHLALFQGGTTYAVEVFDNGGTLLGSGSVTIPSCIAAPPVVTIVDVPAQPGVNDPDGLDNATWQVPSDDATFSWVVDGDGHLIVTIVAADTTFPDGSTTHDYGIAPDSGVVTPPSTKPITGKAYNDHGCDSTEWHFVITGVDDPAHAPASIHVVWADGSTADVPLDKVSGKVAHYATTAHLDSAVVSISTDIYTGWDGQFNVSHGPCDIPPTVTKIDLPAQPAVTDPCGVDNATWVVPADTEVLDWTLGQDGHLVVSIKPENTQFKDGTTTHDYGIAPDSGELCPPNVTEIELPATPAVTDPCGVDNATWNVPSDDDTFTWTVDGDGHLIVTIVAANTTFIGGATTHDYGIAPDSGELCPVGEDQYATAAAGDCGEVVFTNRFDQTIIVLYGDRTLPGPDDSVEVGAGESVEVTTAREFLDWVAYVASDYRFAGNGGVAVQQDCDVPPPVVPEPPVAPVPPVVYVPVPVDVIPAPVAWVTIVVQAAAPVAVVDAAPTADDGYYDPFYQATGWGDRGTTSSGGDQFILPSLAFLLAVAYLVRRRLRAVLQLM